MMRFPLADLLSERGCYNYLLRGLHPAGFRCPAHPPSTPGAGEMVLSSGW